MIKLNNKNITYVALADSNNSLKAPKEIWYADSNNSVKLVYRRKDALIEGEDYEKYHWLKSTNAPCIDTLINPVIGDFLRAEARQQDTYPTVRNIRFIISKGDDESLYLQAIGSATSIEFYSRQGNTESQILLTDAIANFPIPIDIDMSMTVMGNNTEYTLLFNGVQYQSISSLLSLQGYETYKILGSGNNGYLGLGNCRLKRITINSHIFIPCKLLKPVPKWLDANGIRRQVGECGMIDLVSGKFYGNVNSTGTFTVENYYERKEWLVGDGSAYIDTGHNVNEDLDYETKAHLLPNTYLFWYRSGKPYDDQTKVVMTKTSTTKNTRVAKNSVDVRIGDTAIVEVQWNNNEFLANGVNYIPSKRAITFNYELYLFYAYLADIALTGYSSNNVKCSYFRFLDSNRNYILNLIPCTLTMDLPASMDANNIARTKGTSGMWDLVSDRFYGNVANSGTFKAVNLAEGVDYEVHQWLVGDGSAYIDTLINPSFGDELNATFTFSSKPTISNISLLVANDNVNIVGLITGGDFPRSGYPQLLIMNRPVATTSGYIEWGSGSMGTTIKDEYYMYMKINNAQMPDTVVKTDGVICNYSSIIGDNRISEVPTTSYKIGKGYSIQTGLDTVKLKNITISSKINLTPCRLLRPIPAKYDANGIARQANECGMYDTVNDLFYGNVASSGSFTVEDDN